MQLRRYPTFRRARMRWCWSGQAEAVRSGCCIPRKSSCAVVLRFGARRGGVRRAIVSCYSTRKSSSLADHRQPRLFPAASSARLWLVSCRARLRARERNSRVISVSGSSSAVERQLPKLDVAGSIPVSRSIFFVSLHPWPLGHFLPQALLQLNCARHSLASDKEVSLAACISLNRLQEGPSLCSCCRILLERWPERESPPVDGQKKPAF